MIKYFLLFSCCFTWIALAAQRTVDVTKSDGVSANSFFSVGGEPFVNAKFVRLTSGTPYFSDEWMRGIGVSENGTMYKAGILKLNLLDDAIHYLDSNGTEMVATVSLKEVLLTDTINQKSYHFIHSSLLPSPLKKGWYLQLSNGVVGLYQFFWKDISETKPYGSATTEQKINTKEEFYLLQNNSLKQVKKPKDLLLLLPEKQKALEDHLKEINAMKLSTAEQFKVLVDYYNKLQ